MFEGNGVKVEWPNGINANIAHDIIFDYFSPMIESEEVNEVIALPDRCTDSRVISSTTESQPFRDNLQELLSLSDAGESVVWPEGFSALLARQVLSRSPNPS